ncbi:MAG TPA: ComF family protein, partial [Chthonomonadales bacterium]|nr:ComF family protein [Chthonomonadales bacterium]
AIHRLKYSGRTGICPQLAELLEAAIRRSERQPPLLESGELGFDYVIAVPLHRSRAGERGFNQAERIAICLARRIGSAYDRGALRRIRRTRSQTTLSRSERRSNVDGAFGPGRNRSFAGKSVLLIDDVITTGSTTTRCAEVLRAMGAREIWIAALARDLASTTSRSLHR